MSVNGNYSGGLVRPTVVEVGTSATDIQAYEQQLTVVSSMVLCNTTSGAITVDLAVVQEGVSAVFWRGSIAADSTHIITDAPIKLLSGAASIDKVTATASGTGVNLTAIVLAGSGNATVDR